MTNEIFTLDHIHYMFKLVLQSGILFLDPIHYMVKLMLHWESEAENLLTCLLLHFNFVLRESVFLHLIGT